MRLLIKNGGFKMKKKKHILLGAMFALVALPAVAADCDGAMTANKSGKRLGILKKAGPKKKRKIDWTGHADIFQDPDDSPYMQDTDDFEGWTREEKEAGNSEKVVKSPLTDARLKKLLEDSVSDLEAANRRGRDQKELLIDTLIRDFRDYDDVDQVHNELIVQPGMEQMQHKISRVLFKARIMNEQDELDGTRYAYVKTMLKWAQSKKLDESADASITNLITSIDNYGKGISSKDDNDKYIDGTYRWWYAAYEGGAK
jgi:hypothetical protein